jgi:hypothetical protein
MLNQKDYKEVQAKIRMLLETILEEGGKSSQFVKRPSKMTAQCFGQTMVLGCLADPNKSLSGFAQVSADLEVDISPSGLNQRINEESVTLLKEVLGKSIQLSQSGKKAEGILQQFQSVQVVDSSYMKVPKGLQEEFPGIGGPQAAGMKMWLNYDYLRGEIIALDVTAGREADQKSRIHIDHAHPGSLHLFDLGFFKQETFAEFGPRDAYFISRYQTQTALYEPNDDQTRFDLVRYLQKSDADQIDLPCLLGQKAKVPVRLVCQRLPKQVAAARRRKAKQKAKADGRRKVPTERTLQLLDWAIFITNVPSEMLTVEQIVLIYRLRWQIELIFKLWKSRARLKEIGPFRRERILCQFYARLIGIVLFHWLVAPICFSQKQLSLPKAFSLLQHHMGRFLMVIAANWCGFSKLLSRIEADFMRLAMKDKRKKSPSTYQLLVQAGL